MAEGKKSFIAYSDWQGMFNALPDEVAGKLIKHIFSYVNDENPQTEDYIINALFEQVKATLKRDLKKWEQTSASRSEIGRLGGLKSGEARRSKTKQNEANASKSKQNEHVNVNVNDSVKETIIDDLFEDFIDSFNMIMNKRFRATTSVRSKFNARIKEGYTQTDMLQALENAKTVKYHIESDFKYLTPEFFTRPDKIEMYKNHD